MHANDEALIAELRALAQRLDAPPPELREAARWAFTWRSVDAELAELMADSATDEEVFAYARAEPGPRLLTFEAPRLEVEVQVSADADHRRLTGQVVPPQEARIEVRHAGGVVTVDADALGRFAAEGVAAGPASLRLLLGEGDQARVVDTDWLTV
jgi:hypothetical protein